MGRKKIRNPYEKRSQVITIRMKIGEYQRLLNCASSLDMTISDVCRMYVTQGVESLNKALIEEEEYMKRPEMTGIPPGFTPRQHISG